ncbi:MAG: hypothetical protein J6Y16_11510, partial [Treponema sp.]|nr:hypothetical protein [Treponema sp.]MBP5452854.1 hypothetical protein [Treponema sp.]
FHAFGSSLGLFFEMKYDSFFDFLVRAMRALGLFFEMKYDSFCPLNRTTDRPLGLFFEMKYDSLLARKNFIY